MPHAAPVRARRDNGQSQGAEIRAFVDMDSDASVKG